MIFLTLYPCAAFRRLLSVDSNRSVPLSYAILMARIYSAFLPELELIDDAISCSHAAAEF